MRIQHNIMAMNAYRNYTNNVSAMQRNLEKLSSGYKINRAGDDAAGLAISEKMRAQITGLQTAQKNAKDGISLVQTAEGAMTEIHDMLNRMVELASQSANGTYDNDVDRAQMQKEMDQLRSEVNRIADSSNFNGIKLLDGSLAGSGSVASTNIGNEALTISGTDRMLQAVYDPKGGKKPYEVAGSQTILDKGTATTVTTKTKVTFDFNGLSGTVNGTSSTTDANTVEIKVKLADTTVTIKFTSGTAADSANPATAVTISAASIAEQVLNVLKGSTDGGATAGTGTEIEIGGKTWSLNATNTTATGGKLTLEMKDDPTKMDETAANMTAGIEGVKSTVGSNDSDKAGGLNNSATVGTKVDVGKFPGSAPRANTVFEIKKGDLQDGTKIKLGDKEVILAIGADSKYKTNTGGATLVDLTDFDRGDVDLDVALSRINGAFAGATTDSKATKADGTPAGNTTFTVGVNKDGNLKGLTVQRSDTTVTDPVYTTKEKLAAIFSITVPPMDTTANSADSASGGLMLQIGDTADSFNQLRVNISDMHCSALGIDGISIRDQESAAAAITAIKTAINTVSDVRGTLGATQNRLDHTINNLSVMTENIQDAESTIRDVDVAEEMMAYTKNNILIQSAQAMLAQANQVPQGVLQLLQ